MTNYWKEVWDRRGKSNNDIDTITGWNDVPIDLKKVFEEILNLLDIKPTDRVLEVGCGPGSLALYLRSKCRYTGLDYSQPMLDKHLKVMQNHVVRADANDIPFEDEYFDKSFAFSVFHYFPTKAYMYEVLSEMGRVAKHGIYIGDLPTKSHRKEHLLYKKTDFNGGRFTKGFYTRDRFNVVFK